MNQLISARTEAERVAATTARENALLLDKVTSLENQIKALANPRVPSAPAISAGTPEGNWGDVAAQIKDAVLAEIRPVVQSIHAEREDEKFLTAQKRSFDGAARIHPELADTNSDLFKTFAQIWDGNPDVRGLANGPALVAEAARGLLSEARADAQIRKVAAAATTPRAGRPDESVGEDKDLVEALDTLNKVAKTEGWSSQEFDDYLRLSIHRQFGDQRPR